MSEDITKRLADISEMMMEGQPFNDGDFTDIDEAINEIERLRADLKVMTEEHRLACEDRDFMKLQRDEARLLYCDRQSPADPHKAAEKWGWDCFKNDSEKFWDAWNRITSAHRKRPEPLDRLARLDEEVGF